MDEIYKRFLQLKKMWEEETKLHSSSFLIYDNPNYQEIIKLGTSVVPFMISDFETSPENPPFWFNALNEITGHQVNVPIESVGKVSNIAKLWVEWYKDKLNDLLVDIAKILLVGGKQIEKAGWIGCRYSDCLLQALENIHGTMILRENFESNYQGFVDTDVLLSDGRVFSYEYYYGSCSGCDSWESQSFSDEQVINEMVGGGTYFSSLEEYKIWLDKKLTKKRI